MLKLQTIMNRREAIIKVNWVVGATLLGANSILGAGCQSALKLGISLDPKGMADGLQYRPPVDFKRIASLAVHHYSSMLDENYHNLPYFFTKLDAQESYAMHSEWDFGDATGRFLDSVILCEQMIGGQTQVETKNKLKDALRWMRSDQDGLFYRKANEWGVKDGAGMFDQRSAFLGLLSWYFEKKDDEPKRYIDQLIQGLKRIGVERDDYICFPFEIYVPGMAVPEKIYTEHGFVVNPCTYGGGVFILPLAIYYEATGDKEALYLLEKITRFITNHSRTFAADGSFWSRARYEGDGQFHTHMATVAGILRFATIKPDPELVKWCHHIYKWACSMGSTYGWFPEGTGINGKEPVVEKFRWLPGIIQHSETCCTTDMIHSAIYLAKNEMQEHWDHAERYMNVLSASQIKDISWAKTVTDKPETATHTYRDIPARYVGGFTGRMNPNDFTNQGVVDTMACCCAAGSRGVYLLWKYAVEKKNKDVFVNFWFSKETDDVKVASAIPQKGSLKVDVKKNCSLYIRIPGWLDPKNMHVSDGKKDLKYTIKGNYLLLNRLRQGDAVNLEFPLETRVVPEMVAGKEYQVSWRGNYLIAIDPKGKFMPLDSML